MKTVSNPHGEIELLDPAPDLLQAIRSILPFGVIPLVPPQQDADFGLVMQCGEQQLSAVKLQPGDSDERTAFAVLQANSVLIALAVGVYARHGYAGLFLPCAYLRDKGNDRVESGIALFGFPARTDREVGKSRTAVFDQDLGRGYSAMMMSFLHDLEDSAKKTGIPLQKMIGVEVRRFQQLGTLFLGFLSIGASLVCLKTAIADADPAWTALLSAGKSRVIHMPSLPIAIRDDQLSTAKAHA